MEYRRLGRTGLKVSAFCLGSWHFGTKQSEAESLEIIEAALSAGVNFIDTANVYGGGRSETIVGKAVKQSRDQVVLATKVRVRVQGDANGAGLSRYSIFRECERSLRRMQTDHIDLYQVHAPDNTTPIDETMGALNDLVRQGKVRYLGCSNFPAWRLCKALWVSDICGYSRFDSVQPCYNVAQREIEKDLVPLCEEEGVGIIPYSPLAGGFLTGKYRQGETPPPGSRYAEGDSLGKVATEHNFSILNQLHGVALRRCKAVNQVALAWLLGRPMVSSAVIGVSSVEQLVDNLKAIEWRLTDEEFGEIG